MARTSMLQEVMSLNFEGEGSVWGSKVIKSCSRTWGNNILERLEVGGERRPRWAWL